LQKEAKSPLEEVCASPEEAKSLLEGFLNALPEKAKSLLLTG
jgi:hypothetical protein